MDYEGYFKERLDALDAEGRYRTFADLERRCGRFPRAFDHRVGVEKGERAAGRQGYRSDFLLGLKARGLHGVEFVVADDHAGLRAALREVLAQAAYQRCYVHFLRNALEYVPRRVDDDCLQELRWLYHRRDLPEARRDLAALLAKWSGKYSKLTGWVEENIDETLTFYRLPRQDHKHLTSTNMLERLNRRSGAAPMSCASFPMAKVVCGSCARSPSRPTKTGSSSTATSTWTIREHKKEALRRAA